MKELSNEELFSLAKTYGQNVLVWRMKFMGLLSEVNRRGLFRMNGYSSIFVFAYKLAGLSEKQVKLAISLDKHFEYLPLLKMEMSNGSVSINKLARIASIANHDNERLLVEKVKILPQKALETFVRDVKGRPANNHELLLSKTIQTRLLELQNKGININSLLCDFLDQRESKLAEEKALVRNEQLEKENNGTVSRDMPRKVQEILEKEHGTICVVKNCQKPFEHFHHTRPFAIQASHDPNFIAPLCKEHHAIAHSINAKVHSAVMRY